MDVELNYIPHNKQREVHRDTHRFRVICAGRRFGKSLLAASEVMRYAFTNPVDKTPNIAWIAPTYATAERGVEAFELIDKLKKIHKRKGKSPVIIELLTGHKIWFLSADHEDSLRGFGFCFAVIDEADFIADTTYRDVIRPTLADNLARAIIISTPKRKMSWFHKLYNIGLEEHAYIKSFHFKSSDNPYIPKEEIENARTELPLDVFRSEWEAVWIESGGEVFVNIEQCKCNTTCQCESTSTILGVDLARLKDFTVLTALCPCCMHIKEIYRTTDMDWGLQKAIIYKKWEHYTNLGNCITVMDASGIGDVVLDNLRNDGMEIVPFRFSNPSKVKLINDLRAKIATNDIKIPFLSGIKLDNTDQLIKELEGYEMSITKNGSISFGNGLGVGYDDCVISLALCVHGINNFISPKINVNMDTEANNDYGLWGDDGLY